MVETLPSFLAEAAATAGSTPALIMPDGGTMSFAELDSGAAALAGGLMERGVSPGDIVLIWLPNEPAWLEMFFACAHIGAIAFAVNTRFRAADLADLLTRTRAKAIVYRSRFLDIDFGQLVADAAERAGSRPPLEIVIGRPHALRVIPFDALTGADATTCGTRTGSTVDAQTGAVLFATSGTTSLPKYVLHSHGSIVRHAHDVAAGFNMSSPGAVMLQALPYSGVFGFCQAMGALGGRRPSVVMESFDASLANRLIARHEVTHLNATDDMLATMVEADRSVVSDIAKTSRESLRLIGAASFNRGPDLLSRLASKAALPIVGLYGMSEIQALFARRSLDDPPDVRFLPGGRPVAKTGAVRVRDPDTGQLLPEGVTGAGSLEVTGPSVFSGYFGDDAATAGTILVDGYVRTGDYGSSDGSTGFTFVTRIGDTLRLGGYLVNPSEIAEFIVSLPGVAGCQVVDAVADGRTRAVAFVIASEGAMIDPARILESCRGSIAGFKVPALVHVLTEFPAVDSPNGMKIQRGELRHLAEQILREAG